MDDIEQTTVIDPAQVGRMASSRADGRSTTMYGRHRRFSSADAVSSRRPCPI